jgi:hypothetical protein
MTPKTPTTTGLAESDAARNTELQRKIAEADALRRQPLSQPITPAGPVELPPSVCRLGATLDQLAEAEAERDDLRAFQGEHEDKLASLETINPRDEVAVATYTTALAQATLAERKLDGLENETHGRLAALHRQLANQMDEGRRVFANFAAKAAHYAAHAIAVERHDGPEVRELLLPIRNEFLARTTFGGNARNTARLIVERAQELLPEMQALATKWGALDFDAAHDFLNNTDRVSHGSGILSPRGTPRTA